MNIFETCLHRCHFKNCYEYCSVNAAKYSQRKIVKYSKNDFFLKRKLFVNTTPIVVNKIAPFQTLARRNCHKIQILKRTSLNTFKIIPHKQNTKRIRITDKTYFTKRPIIFNMKSKYLNSFLSTFLPTSRSIYCGETDYLLNTVKLCYVVFESVRLIGRQLSLFKKELGASSSLNQIPNPLSSTILQNNSETSNLEEICTVPVSQQSTEQMECKSLVSGYMKSPNKRMRTSFNTKLSGDSSTPERDLDCLSRKQSKRSSLSNLNNIKSGKWSSTIGGVALQTNINVTLLLSSI